MEVVGLMDNNEALLLALKIAIINECVRNVFPILKWLFIELNTKFTNR